MRGAERRSTARERRMRTRCCVQVSGLGRAARADGMGSDRGAVRATLARMTAVALAPAARAPMTAVALAPAARAPMTAVALAPAARAPMTAVAPARAARVVISGEQ
ncbi:uncharacterized protein SOCE836_013140 [Sorangium cellulosum]|uniref:Uncharacterized protein n=1 Tax=Sorangium cellulosum TaxID=56 RepID=A0A4P2QHY5_SORCE|nr:uncharacterized protein SOCE836_013140 [Sorangium cellulosum]WCQ88617.1 hypothetical protein NQZ70_01296 [Sorangium sp. Soce836]